MAKTNYKKKIKNGKEYYFYRLRHDNLLRPKDIYGTTIKELETKIKSITHELDYGVNNKEYFETFFRDWLFDVHFVGKKPATKEKYEGIYRNYIKNSDISSIKIKDISSRDIQSYYNKLIKKGKSISCIKTLNKLIAPCIRYAYNNNMLIKDFTKSIVLPKQDGSIKFNKANEVNPFTKEEQIQFINAIKGHELEMLFLTALNTGLRQGELLALTWNDINFDEYYIDVNKSLGIINDVSKEGRGKSKIIIQAPKTEKGNRRVTIPTFLVRKLKQYKAKQLENKLKVGNLYEDNLLLFCDQFGKYLDRRKTLEVFKKVLKDNGLKDKKFHDLRHTFATRLFELGENPKTVQELLGHSNISITLDTYTHVLDSMKEKVASKLNDLYLTMGTK